MSGQHKILPQTLLSLTSLVCLFVFFSLYWFIGILRNFHSLSSIKNNTHLVSLNAKNARLLPLSSFNDNDDEKTHSDDLNVQTGYYDIKIHNEKMDKIDYTLFKSYKKSNSYVAIPFNVQPNITSKSSNGTHVISSESSSSILGSHSSYCSNSKSEESLDTSLLSSSPDRSTTPLSSVSQTSLTALASPTVYRHEFSSDPLTQPVRVEYVPQGKIITINVSIMWWLLFSSHTLKGTLS
jgi:hypothetical protein